MLRCCLLIFFLVVNTLCNEETVANNIVEASVEVKNEAAKALAEAEQQAKPIGDGVRAEIQRAADSVRENAAKATENANKAIQSMDACNSSDCNNRGSCLGTRNAYVCLCQLGYSGKNCEAAVCDSTRDCNGRGICLGTNLSLTCLCNMGYTGARCESVV